MKIAVILLALVLAGCAAAPPTKVPLFSSTRSANPTTEFNRTLAGCQIVLSGFERQASDARRWSVGIQSAGGLLGAVLLPVAVVKHMAQSVITLLGALSGYANTELSVVRNEGLDAATVLSTRANIIDSMKVALGKHYAAMSTVPLDQAKLAAATDELRAACIAYAIADPNSALIDAGP
jgi:hypothetical protein